MQKVQVSFYIQIATHGGIFVLYEKMLIMPQNICFQNSIILSLRIYGINIFRENVLL